MKISESEDSCKVEMGNDEDDTFITLVVNIRCQEFRLSVLSEKNTRSRVESE